MQNTSSKLTRPLWYLLLLSLAGCGRSNHNMDTQSTSTDPVQQASTSTGQPAYNPSDHRIQVIRSLNLTKKERNEALARLSSTPKYYLDLSGLGINNEGFLLVAKAIKKDLYLSQHLKELDFSNNCISADFPDDKQHIFSLIESLNNTAVTTINLDYNLTIDPLLQETVIQAANTTQLKHVSMYLPYAADWDLKKIKSFLATLSKSNIGFSCLFPGNNADVYNPKTKSHINIPRQYILTHYIAPVLSQLPIIKGGIVVSSERKGEKFLQSGIVEKARITNLHIGRPMGIDDEERPDKLYDLSIAEEKLEPILRRNKAYVQDMVEFFKRYVTRSADGLTLAFSSEMDYSSDVQINTCIDLMEQLISSPVIRSHIIEKSDYTKNQIRNFIENIGTAFSDYISLREERTQEYYDRNVCIAQRLDKKNKGKLTQVVKDFLYHWPNFSPTGIPAVIRNLCHKYGMPLQSGTLLP